MLLLVAAVLLLLLLLSSTDGAPSMLLDALPVPDGSARTPVLLLPLLLHKHDVPASLLLLLLSLLLALLLRLALLLVLLPLLLLNAADLWLLLPGAGCSAAERAEAQSKTALHAGPGLQALSARARSKLLLCITCTCQPGLCC